MKKGLKTALISIGFLTGGVILYKILKGKKVEENGLPPNESETQTQESENTMGVIEDGNVISTPIAVGDILYPSGEYVNVRFSAMVNNGWINNIMTEIESPNAIGVVEDILVSDGHTWYKVQLNQDLTEYSFGYVRSDVVTKTI
tara:strand:+ start:1264 stop:1695 length:432 start_codon:yes stop_codon:yes gene_type:complete